MKGFFSSLFWGFLRVFKVLWCSCRFGGCQEAIFKAIWTPKWRRNRHFLGARRRPKTVFDIMCVLHAIWDGPEWKKLGFRTIGVQFLSIQQDAPEGPKMLQKCSQNHAKMGPKSCQKRVGNNVQITSSKWSVFEAIMRPKRLPRWILKSYFERPKWNKNSMNSGHSLENGSRCYWEPSGHPFWSQNRANLEPKSCQKRVGNTMYFTHMEKHFCVFEQVSTYIGLAMCSLDSRTRLYS